MERIKKEAIPAVQCTVPVVSLCTEETHVSVETRGVLFETKIQDVSDAIPEQSRFANPSGTSARRIKLYCKQ
jgi:hypothetical protein